MNNEKGVPFSLRTTPGSIRMLRFDKVLEGPTNLSFGLLQIEVGQGIGRLVQGNALPPPSRFLLALRQPYDQLLRGGVAGIDGVHDKGSQDIVRG